MRRELYRKGNRLKDYDYGQAGVYFVTICAKDHAQIFGAIVGATVPGRPHTHVELTPLGKQIENAIEYYNSHMDDVIFDRYVIMPNHIHALLSGLNRATEDGRPYSILCVG